MHQKIAIITGSSSGIGKALVEKLAKENVVFAGYRAESKGLELGELSENIFPFYVDYAKPETIAEAIKFIKSKTEKVDSLINIAGCVVAGPIEKIPMTEIRRQFEVNVFGHVELTQGLIDALEGVTDQDAKIAGEAHEAGKGVVILYNKWDTVEKDSFAGFTADDEDRR